MDTTPFRFRGEILALDLINTEVRERGKPKDLLDTPTEIERWWQFSREIHPEMATVLASPPRFDEGLRERLADLRGHLRGLVTALTQHQPLDDADLNALNRILATGYLTIQPTGDEFETVYAVPNDPYGAIQYPIAESMWRLLTTGDMHRLHKCNNERCIMYFYDTTRSATRMYCNLACLERARSAERYKQSKEQGRSDAAESEPGQVD